MRSTMSLRRVLLAVGVTVAVCVDLASCGTASSVEGTADKGQCLGTCAPPQSGWKGPAVLWSGPKEKVPSSCPAWAPSILYQGNADLVASNECTGACTCGPPTGAPSYGDWMLTRRRHAHGHGSGAVMGDLRAGLHGTGIALQERRSLPSSRKPDP